MMGLIIDCGSDGSWTETVRPLTDEEITARDAALAAAADAHAAAAAKAAGQQAARDELAAKAATDPTARLYAQAIGLDIDGDVDGQPT